LSRIALLIPEMPVCEDLVPFFRRIDDSRKYANFGPLVGELEAALSAWHRAPDGKLPHAISMANATLGLQLTLEALGLQSGARVLVPGLTFPASVLAIQRAGLTPVICDVDAANWMLTVPLARRAIEIRQFHAVMPVSTFGCPQDCAAWDEFAANTGVPVVIDAAGAFGNQRAGLRVHTVISLHATKTLGAGEGSVLLTHDTAIAERTRRLSNFGYDIEPGLVIACGTNAKLSEYHAAVALAALAQWHAKALVRQRLHAEYVRHLQADCAPLKLQVRPPDGTYSILSVMLPAGRRAQHAATFLADRAIETRRWYCPIVPDHPIFSGLETVGGIAEIRALGERLLGLPFHPFLGTSDIGSIVSALAAYLGH
jgi:dTDP-4-amino-4,6-dideoxygalactose transaminase